MAYVIQLCIIDICQMKEKKTMTTHISDDLTWTDQEEKDTAKDVVNMINSSQNTIRKFKEGSCDVYEVSSGSEKKVTIVNRKMEDKDQGSWVIFSGKFERTGIGPFVDGSSFDQEITNGTGIRKTVNNKIALQQHTINRGYGR